MGPVVQHRLVVRDQHELAVLRRRDDALLLQPDGGPDGPELRLGGDRHRGGHRAHPRHHGPPQRDADAGQLLAGPRAGVVLHPAADLDRRRGAARLAGRPADARRHGRRPARGPVASQEAIKELGTNGGGFFNVNSAYPFENPTALSNLIELFLDPLHPGLADLHLRAHGRQPPPGLGALLGHVGALHRQRRRRLHRRDARHAGPARAASTPASSTARPAATWRARTSASASPTRRCGRRSPRSPRAARSTRRWNR